MCALLSYGTFIAIGLLTLGLGAVTPYMTNQPMIPVLLSVAATWIYAAAGDAQFEREEDKRRIAEIEAVPVFQCATATPEEITLRGIRRGLKDDQIERLIFYHRNRHYRKAAFERFGVPPGTAKDEKRRWTALLEKE